MHHTPAESRWRVPFEGKFEIAKASTRPFKGAPDKEACEERLAEVQDELQELQRRLYAQDTWSLLLVFQAMDAAGKDSTIRAVMSGVDPAGCQVWSFKAPSSEELDHDFLWRAALRLPERGRIGIWNRSHYEEVVVVRVHPEYLRAQKLPRKLNGKALDGLWEDRYQSIRDWERHLASNGTVIVKFFLHVSKEEQRERFLARIEEPEKNWKFSLKDVHEREHWDAYQAAFQDALGATSRPWAPWYAIPADQKAYMRLAVAEVVRDTLKELDPRYPVMSKEDQADLETMRERLEAEKE